MIVRIRFGPGRRVTPGKKKNISAARLTASLLGLVSISLAVFGFWRLGQDLGFVGDFVFASGLLSHWQVWIASAAAVQYVSWRLAKYSRALPPEDDAAHEDENDAEEFSARV